jgi:hypothetical protein
MQSEQSNDEKSNVESKFESIFEHYFKIRPDVIKRTYAYYDLFGAHWYYLDRKSSYPLGSQSCYPRPILLEKDSKEKLKNSEEFFTSKIKNNSILSKDDKLKMVKHLEQELSMFDECCLLHQKLIAERDVLEKSKSNEMTLKSLNIMADILHCLEYPLDYKVNNEAHKKYE